MSSSAPISVGLRISTRPMTIGDLRAFWQVADEGGFDHLWTFDHFAAVGRDPERPVYEAWTMLGAMAEATERVRIGCIVTGNTYRHPGVLAKMAVTVDHLSGGRLEFGIGGAWVEFEHTMFDLEFRTPGWRIDRLEEACQVLKLLWTEERPSFEGSHYVLREAVGNPKPLQKPWPPIWIGGSGERKTLRVVAEHADVWNVPDRGVDESARLSGVLDRHCADVGRDPADIRRSVQIIPRDGPEDALALAEAYVDRGFTDIVIALVRDNAVADAETLANEVLPRLRQLDPGR